MSLTAGALKRTPLYQDHVAAGARMVEFGGWDMPVQYSSILKEHAAVRTAAGLFDISHMGEFRVRGPGSVNYLNELLTNNVNKIQRGNSQYSILLNDEGGVIDDLFVYRLGEQEFLIVVNASMIDEDFKVFEARKPSDVNLSNESDDTAALALQGPKSNEILEKWIPGAPAKLGHHAIAGFKADGLDLLIARTGYTGEDGFEIIVDAEHASKVWNKLLQLGGPAGLVPCGLGSRDTLRLEVCYPLNGHELGPTISPLEAGIGFFVDFTKPKFVGRDALLKQKSSGVTRKSVALVCEAGGPPPRAGYSVQKDGKVIGTLTSGVLSPSLQKGIGLGLISADQAAVGGKLDIEIRGKLIPATIVKKPIYQKSQSK